MRPGKFLALVAGLAIALPVAEIATRLLLPQPGFLPSGDAHLRQLIVPHPVRGYAYAPGFLGRKTTADYDIVIRTNSLGFRSTSGDAPSRVEVLAAGNSFTAGFGVNVEDAWPARLETAMRTTAGGQPLQVFNAGVSGYGLHQIRQTVEELVPRLSPKLVIVGAYPSRYWRITNPYTYVEGRLIRKNRSRHVVFLDSGTLTSKFRNPTLAEIDLWLKQHFRFGAYLLAGGRSVARRVSGKANRESSENEIELRLQPFLQELDAIRQITARHGTQFVALLVNHQLEDGSFAPEEYTYNDVVIRYCRARDIRVFDPLPELVARSNGTASFRLRSDLHWSEQAHELVADLLSEYLERERLLEFIKSP